REDQTMKQFKGLQKAGIAHG
ncbi:MAG: hypothetical protein EZS28_045538, partial [Streblomastix strix]